MPSTGEWGFPEAFQSICKLSTLMGRQSHPVVTKLRRGIVSFARNCSTCSPVRTGYRGAEPLLLVENKDHSALIAPLRSNRGTEAGDGYATSSVRHPIIPLLVTHRRARFLRRCFFPLPLPSLHSPPCLIFVYPLLLLLLFQFFIYFVSTLRPVAAEERRRGADFPRYVD